MAVQFVNAVNLQKDQEDDVRIRSGRDSREQPRVTTRQGGVEGGV